MIKVIVGLGNPGPKYERTRHNAGFLFVDRLATCSGCHWSNIRQFHGEMAECDIGGNRVMLLKPMTFMNKSGLAVGALMRYYKLDVEQILVAHDELELPENVARLKRDGGHAGHNGLRDIIANIGSRDFFRLRIGVGRPLSGIGVADYVLSSLDDAALISMENLFDKLTKNLDVLISADIDAFNRVANLA